jgi:hypothetical protein
MNAATVMSTITFIYDLIRLKSCGTFLSLFCGHDLLLKVCLFLVVLPVAYINSMQSY